MKAYAKLVNNGLEAFEVVNDLHRHGCGDALRSKIESMGFNSFEASMYESELDKGKVLVMARQ
ncbi:hypothetical protein [Cohnella sp.]|uniref:hypothetical protein n=1 Tax=Cohnella sp. TaxID=1883426 RepID=UPI0035617D51